MQYDPNDNSPRDTYGLMIQLVTPRPIAWVSTISNEGVANIAPFSYFNAVGSNPPSLMFCPANRRDGTRKDTLVNIEQTGEFVVNLVSFDLSDPMACSAQELAPEESEFDHCGIETVPSERVRPARVKAARAQFECTLLQALHLGTGPGGANMVIGRIELIHVADEVVLEERRIDARKLDNIGRMGGKGYARTTDLFDIG